MFTLFVGSLVIELLTARMRRELDEARTAARESGRDTIPHKCLTRGAQWIGICERALIFVLVLIGTLMSFCWRSIGGWLTKFLLTLVR